MCTAPLVRREHAPLHSSALCLNLATIASCDAVSSETCALLGGSTKRVRTPLAVKLSVDCNGRASRYPRQRVFESGKIIYANGSIVVDCTIRNISQTGAQLKVPTTVAIPDQFEFREAMGGKGRAVTVVWRKGDLIGIRFA